jgi:hypothetical protein
MHFGMQCFAQDFINDREAVRPMDRANLDKERFTFIPWANSEKGSDLSWLNHTLEPDRRD